jgi:cytidylate kinase
LETAIQGNAVIEGHLVPWVVKDYADLLIYVTAPLGERVKRIAKREHRDWKEVLIETAKREFSHALRFRKYYGLDLCDLSIFDYVIDTSNTSVNDVTKIMDHILQVHFGVG